MEDQTWNPIKVDISVEILSYQWIVPDILTSEGKIRIVQDNVDIDYEDINDNFTISSVSINYEPVLVKENKLWSNTWIGTELGDHFHSYYIKFEGDITINNKVYKKIFKSEDESQLNWKLHGYIREDSSNFNTCFPQGFPEGIDDKADESNSITFTEDLNQVKVDFKNLSSSCKKTRYYVIPNLFRNL